MKSEVEMKGLRVGKIKIMVTGINLELLSKSGKYPSVGSNAIFCGVSVMDTQEMQFFSMKGVLRLDSEKSLEKARPVINRRTIHIPTTANQSN